MFSGAGGGGGERDVEVGLVIPVLKVRCASAPSAPSASSATEEVATRLCQGTDWQARVVQGGGEGGIEWDVDLPEAAGASLWRGSPPRFMGEGGGWGGLYAMDFEAHMTAYVVLPRSRLSKDLCIVAVCSKYTRELTFENFSKVLSFFFLDRASEVCSFLRIGLRSLLCKYIYIE